MAFAPLHHNIGGGYAFDLFGAEGLTPTDREMLAQKGARYLVISRRSYLSPTPDIPQIIGYFSEQGDFTSLYEGPMTFDQVPSP